MPDSRDGQVTEHPHAPTPSELEDLFRPEHDLGTGCQAGPTGYQHWGKCSCGWASRRARRKLVDAYADAEAHWREARHG